MDTFFRMQCYGACRPQLPAQSDRENTHTHTDRENPHTHTDRENTHTKAHTHTHTHTHTH